MRVRKLNLEAWSNVSFPNDPIVLYDSNGPIDLTGCTARMQVRTPDGALLIDVSGPSEDGIEFSGVADGGIVIHIEWQRLYDAWSASALRAGSSADLVYDLVVTDPSGLEQARLEGRFRIRAGVTIQGWAALKKYNDALATPPFAEYMEVYREAVPDATTTVYTLRTATDYITVRQWRSWGAIDEYTYRDTTGTNFDGGWVLWAWRVFALGICWPILLQPSDVGQATANEIAFRLGLIGTDVYPTDYHFDDVNGLALHGNMSKTGDKDFRISSDLGTNIEPVSAFPVGTVRGGTSFNMEENYNMKYRGVTNAPGTNVATLNVLRSFAPGLGSAEIFTFAATVANVGFQDSPAPMMATNFGGPFDRARMGDDPLIVSLVGSGGQKGNWRVTNPNRSGIARFFPSTEPRIAPTVQALRGPMVGKGAPAYTDLAPYAGNRFALWHVTDQSNFAKLTGYMVSAEETLPRNAEPMTLGKTFQAYTARGTEYNATGWDY